MTKLSTNLHPGSDSLFGLFDRQAKATPDRIAVVDSEGETRYQTLRQHAEAIHIALLSNDIAPNTVVAILMERSADLVAAMLGALRAGCAFVALDPKDPPERLARLMTRCNAAALLTDAPSTMVDILVKSDKLRVMKPGKLLRNKVDAAPAIVTGMDRLAYLLFTSGTTGEPKAVMVSQSNILHLLGSAENLLKITPTDRYLAVSTVAFDASVIEIFLPLMVGASLLLRDGNLLLSPNRLAREIKDNGVTIMQTAPSVWASVLKNAGHFPKLRIAITHGEAAPIALAEQLMDQAEIAFNLYGPTETTVWAVGHQLVAGHKAAGASAPIGRPLDHVQTYVVDDAGQVMEGAAEGELWLGGASVALGYWQDAPLTKAKFTQLGAERVYKTGDRVRRDSDGLLHFLGRFDDQLQLHGVRVEPGEIEALAREHPMVEAAIATWFEDPDRGRQMLVAVAPHADKSLLQAEVYDFLAGRVPRRMLPSVILVLPTFPLTQNGKIDRPGLRSLAVAQRKKGPEPHRQASSTDFESPTERDIAACWQRILGVPVTSRNEQFFILGGDSLSAVHMISELETLYDIALQLNCIFEHPTIRSLARHIDAVALDTNMSAAQSFVIPIGQQNTAVSPLFFCNIDMRVAKKGVWTPDLPLCGVVHWSKRDGLARASSIVAMAEMLLSRIKDVQAAGPYRLAGYSFGGLLAYEIAQQLQAAGDEVEFLFLLDPTPPKSPDVLTLQARIKARIKRIAQGPVEIGFMQWIRAFNPWSSRVRQRVRYHLETPQHNLVDWRIRNPNRLKWLPIPLKIWHAYDHFARPLIPHYKPKPYSGRTLIVECAVGHDGGSAYKTLLTGDVEQMYVESRHDLLFGPPVLNDGMQWLVRQIR